MKDKTATLALLRRDDKLLLAMKKRGFGQGYWNGPGGKPEPGETLEQALVRECQEEIGVTPDTFHKVAEHDFLMDADTKPWHMVVHAYLCTSFHGQPVESEEMKPRWFKLADIPYNDMWQDDAYWLPQVLTGKLLKTSFTFDASNHMLSHTIREVTFT